jgi:hypothetical protein
MADNVTPVPSSSRPKPGYGTSFDVGATVATAGIAATAASPFGVLVGWKIPALRMAAMTGTAAAIPMGVAAAISYPLMRPEPKRSPGRVEAAEVLRPMAWASFGTAAAGLVTLAVAGAHVVDSSGPWRARNLPIAHWTWGALGIGCAAAGVIGGVTAIVHKAHEH